MTAPLLFHAGEVALQQRTGMHDRLAPRAALIIRDHMPEQHRELFGKLPTLLVGSVDDDGQPWASMLAGAPGFLSTPDARHLHVAAWPSAGDPLGDNLRLGRPLGLLGLEPHTRRRNRLNGPVAALDAGRGFTVEVAQSFGNCPQYIQAREPLAVPPAVDPTPMLGGARLEAAARALAAAADTFFIASAAPAASGHGADVSHRGGRPGFVRVDDDDGGRTRLTWPDFRGNSMFNTLGNLALEPRAGLLFFDPARGDLLQVAGRAETMWEGDELRRFAGAERLVRLVVERHRWWPRALPLRWSAPVPAPQIAATGRW